MAATAPKLTVVRRQRLQTRCFRERLAPQRDPELCLTMVELPAGSFAMGSPPNEAERLDAEGPQHDVSLERFWLGQTPITQAQWRAVAQWPEQEGERWGRELMPNPSKFQNRPGAEAIQLLAGEINTDQRPVEQVSWHDAIEFCNRLSQRNRRHRYSLPSEAQWEYACRAGSTTPFHFGPTLTPDLANYNGNLSYADGPSGVNREQTTPVASFPANAWGLQDMHGNVWEWCLDDWHSNDRGAPDDARPWYNQQGKNSTANKSLRGGSCNSPPKDCRSASRSFHNAELPHGTVGFRVCCSPRDDS